MEPDCLGGDTDAQTLQALRDEIARLRQENEDLKLTISTTAEHGDVVETMLREANYQLREEVVQRRRAESTLESILETVMKDKADLEMILQATTEHGDTLEYQLYTQAVEAMRESESLFRAISESTPILMILTQRLDGSISFANSTSQEQLGIDAKALIGRRLRDFMVQPEDEQSLTERFEADGQVRNYEMQVCRTDGSILWVSVSVHPLGLGGEQALLTTLYDISDRKQAEATLLDYQRRLEQQAQELERRVEQRTAELREAEAKYRSIFENAVEGIYQLSIQGRYVNANPAMAEILGYDSAEELVTTVVSVDRQVYVQPQRRLELAAYLQRYDAASDFESEVYRKDGTKIWISENIRMIRDANGVVQGYEGSVQDISARRKTEEELWYQRRRTEQLLSNILPQAIAERLKRGEKTIVDSFTQASVLFADIADFTALSSDISPTELVNLLDTIFFAFDKLVAQKGLEKIKTIGDAYMAVGGLPTLIVDPVGAIADLALAMQAITKTLTLPVHPPPTLRIGIHVGPVTAGIIGASRISYDLWGDTVNVASRMESQGEPGRIQVTEAVYRQLAGDYNFESRGIVDIKGKGLMQTYWLLGKKPETHSSSGNTSAPAPSSDIT